MDDKNAPDSVDGLIEKLRASEAALRERTHEVGAAQSLQLAAQQEVQSLRFRITKLVARDVDLSVLARETFGVARDGFVVKEHLPDEDE